MDEFLFSVLINILIWPFNELKAFRNGESKPSGVLKFLFAIFIGILLALLITGIVLYFINESYFVWSVILISVPSIILIIYLIIILIFLFKK